MSALTRSRRGKLGLACGIAVLVGVGLLVSTAVAGADVTKFKSNGGSAYTSKYEYVPGVGTLNRQLTVNENGLKGKERKVLVYGYVYKYQYSPYYYAHAYFSGEIPAENFKVTGNGAELQETDLDGLVYYSYQYPYNAPPLKPGKVAMTWKANGISTHKQTGHTIHTWTDPNSGVTVKTVTNGQSSSESADATGTFLGDYASTGSIGQNKNLSITVTKN